MLYFTIPSELLLSIHLNKDTNVYTYLQHLWSEQIREINVFKLQLQAESFWYHQRSSAWGAMLLQIQFRSHPGGRALRCFTPTTWNTEMLVRLGHRQRTALYRSLLCLYRRSRSHSGNRILGNVRSGLFWKKLHWLLMLGKKLFMHFNNILLWWILWVENVENFIGKIQ